MRWSSNRNTPVWAGWASAIWFIASCIANSPRWALFRGAPGGASRCWAKTWVGNKVMARCCTQSRSFWRVGLGWRVNS